MIPCAEGSDRIQAALVCNQRATNTHFKDMVCSVLSSSPVVFESVWRRENCARKAMVAVGGAASASSLAH